MARSGEATEPHEAADRASTRPGWLRRLPDRALDAAIGAGIAVTALAALLLRVDLKTRGTAAFADPGWDRHLYIEMARRDLGDFRLAPYCWRLLVPWLAGISPFSLQASFMAITIAALIASGAGLFLLMRAAAFGRPQASMAVLLFFSLGWGPKFAVADFWIPDATVFAFVFFAILFAQEDRPKALAAVLLVGVLAKESVLFAGPLLYSLHARPWLDWRRARTTALVMLPAVLAIVLVRVLISESNGDASYIAGLPPVISRFPELFPRYNYFDLLQDIVVDQRWRYREWGDFDRYFTDALGVLVLLLAVAGSVRKPVLALRLAPFVVLVYSQLLFATDTQRLIVLSAPAVVWLALEGAEWLRASLRLCAWPFVVLAVATLALTLLSADDYGRTFLWETGIVAAELGLLAAMGWWRHRAMASRPPAAMEQR